MRGMRYAPGMCFTVMFEKTSALALGASECRYELVIDGDGDPLHRRSSWPLILCHMMFVWTSYDNCAYRAVMVPIVGSKGNTVRPRRANAVAVP